MASGIFPLVQTPFTPMPEVRYSSRDFSLMKEALSAWVQAHDSAYWNDLFESNIGLAFMDMMSYLTDVLSYNMDKVANNSFIDTVERYRGMLHITNALGYTPTAPVAARVPVRGLPAIPAGKQFILRGAYFDTSTQSIVPPSGITVDNLNFELAYFRRTTIGDSVLSENLLGFPTVGLETYQSISVIYDIANTSYSVLEDGSYPVNSQFLGEYPNFWTVTIPFALGEYCSYKNNVYQSLKINNTGNVPGDINNIGWWESVPNQSVYGLALLEGTSQADTFIPQAGIVFQSFTSAVSNVIEDSWVVFVNGVMWKQQVKNSLVLANPTDQVYVVRFTETGNLIISFGDGLTHGALPPSIPGSSVILFYRTTGGGQSGNTVITGAISSNVSGYIDSLENSFTVSNADTSGGFGGVDRESLDHIRYMAPSWFKSTERAITKGDFLVLALKCVSAENGSVGKAAVIRPQNDESNALLVPVKQPSSGIFEVCSIDDPAYEKTINVFYPSYMCNVMLVYLWVPVDTDANGDGVVDSVAYLSPTSQGKASLLLEVQNYLNKGNLSEGERQGDVGMTVVQSLALDGFSYYVDIMVNVLVTDARYDVNSVMGNIKIAIYSVFATYVPGGIFSKHALYSKIGSIAGVQSFSLKVVSFMEGKELPDQYPLSGIYKGKYLFTVNQISVSQS